MSEAVAPTVPACRDEAFASGREHGARWGRTVSDADSRDREADRAIRRVLRSFRSPDSYGLVLVMIIATYIAAVSLPGRWGSSIVLFAQIVTVRLSMHTSRAGFLLRRSSDVLVVLAAASAIANLVFHREDALLAVVFLGSSVLCFVAPFSILREIMFRRSVDRETLLGVLSAYLFFGMAFAFTYRFFGHVQNTPFFGAGGEGKRPRRPVLQLRHPDHHRVRQPRARRQPRPEPRRPRGADRPTVPGDRRGQAGQQLDIHTERRQ